MKPLLPLLVALFLLTGVTHGQDSLFQSKIANIPSKWKDESVVILEYKYNYTYKVSMYSFPTKDERVKIVYYIKDKWGVEEFSRLSLPTHLDDENAWNTTIGTVYKSNGTTYPITRDMLISQRKRIDFSGLRRRSLELNSDENSKLAVPSLDVGDILEIDYASASSDPPGIVYLVNEYPMLHFETTIQVDQYGGTNQLVIKPHFKNFPDVSSSSPQKFSIVLDTVEKYREEILSDNFRRIPYVLMRYDIDRSYPDPRDYSNMSFSSNGPNEELQLFMAREVYLKDHSSESTYAKRILSSLKIKYPKLNDTLAYVKDAYYLYRELIASENLFAGNLYRNSRHFACTMSRVLFQKKIRHQIFLSQPDFFGMPDRYRDFLDREYGIYIPGHDLYLFDPLMVYEAGAVPSYYEGHQHVKFSANKYYKRYRYFWYLWLIPQLGIATSPLTLPPYIVQAVRANKYRKFDLQQGSFPSLPSPSNKIDYEITVKEMNPADHTITFDQQAAYLGKHKSQISERVIRLSRNLLKENNPYRKMLAAQAIPMSNKKETEEELQRIDKRLKDLMKAELSSDGFSVKEVRDYSVTQSNLFDIAQPFTHRFSFTARNLVWSFNDYMVINAGAIIGEQLSIPESESERRKDFYIPYQQQFSYTINIPLPDGYEPANLNEFNTSAETEAGLFTTTAKQEGRKVVIRTFKAYKFRAYDSEKAEDVYQFIREADSFYYKKLILRKKS